MGLAPERSKNVYFVGAGVSAAYGLPSTQQLLINLNTSLEKRLDTAYTHFYPVNAQQASGFRPDVVDFFSLLQSYIAITRPDDGPAFPNPTLPDAKKLHGDLKRDIAKRLIRGVRSASLMEPVAALEKMFKPGQVIITSNWDFLLEAYALKQGHRFAYQHRADHASLTTILKLHGSVDWCLSTNRKDGRPNSDYSRLSQMVGTHGSLKADDEVLRVRALERLPRAWQRVSARATEPFMITMAPGKSTELGPVRSLWHHAYWALSSAKEIHVVGYSLPADDVEIRALLVAGIERGNQRLGRLRVQNPSPDVHARFRSLIRRDVEEDYLPLAP